MKTKTQQTKVTYRKQQGALSLEMLLVLVIVLAILGWALSRGTMMQSRSSTLSEATNDIVLMENVRGLLKSAGSYGAAGTDLVPALITAAGVPTDMTISSNQIYNASGGQVTIVSTGAGFTLTTALLAPDVCMQTAIKVSGSVTGVSTVINGGSAISGAVSSAQASSGCNQVGNANSIAFSAS
jgi:hypothetical protein